jgi:S1-C subfamily serine protease
MTRNTWIEIVAFVLLGAGNAASQVGKDTTLWDFTEKDATHHQSIVQITAGDGIGTGIVIGVRKDKPISDGFEGYCLTAWHVVQNSADTDDIRVKYRNGRKAKKCRVVEKDAETDIAILWVWVPGEIPAAEIASDSIKSGDKLEFAGLGGGSELKCCLRHFRGTASSPSTLNRIFADVPLLPGDSGGPVFNEKHQVVGVISGGWFWWDADLTTHAGSKIKATWPARASNVEPIKVLMAKVGSDTTVTNQTVDVSR